MNWDDTKVFLALYRKGSLRSAGKALGVDQATVGRRISAVEESLGAKLFLRTSKGYVLTQAGDVFLKNAVKMEHIASDLVRSVESIDEQYAGEVRISTTDSLGVDFILPALRTVKDRYPSIKITLDTSTDIVNLSRREADIAIRTIKPSNPDLIVRKLASWPIGLFASKTYISQHGVPKKDESFHDHSLVVYSPHYQRGETIHVGGIICEKSIIQLGVNTSFMMRQALVQGMGIGEVAIPLAEKSKLERVWPDWTASDAYDIWLVTHQDFKHTARLRVVIDSIADFFESMSTFKNA